ncbi:hypothetical protein [Roseospira navarrensis]|uniref:Uncharacterized protein n=1 Tax=Roseospira navarrensis TaxID=140058 RepID=A0A7X1ZE29_9PROT|nr:hypothetical protein [Roseospira navarrensis]MQX36349.1 hypothetical protein [Roseospira navarrensis]
MFHRSRFRQAACTFVLGALVLVFSTASGQAASRIFDLHLVNGEGNPPVTFTISAAYHNCYEGNVGIGQQIGAPVGGGGYVTVTLARVQGHGCDGENGVFAIEVSNQPGVLIRFNFDNAGSLWLVDPRNIQPVGILSAKQSDESYVFATQPRQRVSAGKVTGQWVRVCQQFCDMTFKQEITNTTTNTVETSSEIREALSVTLEAGVAFGGASASTSVTASQERSVGQRMSQELATAGMTGTETTISLSLEQMEERGLFAVWQWVATTQLSNGQSIVLTTVKYTCTPAAQPPQYLPDSPEDVQACRRQTASTPVASAPQAGQPVATNVPSWGQIVPSAGAQTDVTQFTLFNDGGFPWSIAWIDYNGTVSPGGDVIAPGTSWVVANGAKTWESHWYAVSDSQGFLCSVSLRQGAVVNFSQLTACRR